MATGRIRHSNKTIFRQISMGDNHLTAEIDSLSRNRKNYEIPGVRIEHLNENILKIYQTAVVLQEAQSRLSSDKLFESLNSKNMSAFLFEADEDKKVAASLEKAREAAIKELEELDAAREALKSTTLDVAVGDLRGKLAAVKLDPASIDRFGGLGTFLGKTSKQLTFIANSIWTINSTVRGVIDGIDSMFKTLKLDPNNSAVKTKTLRQLADAKELQGISTDDQLLNMIQKKSGATIKGAFSRAFSGLKALFTSVRPVEFDPKAFAQELIDIKVEDLYAWINSSKGKPAENSPGETPAAKELENAVDQAPPSARADAVTTTGPAKGATQQSPKTPTSPAPGGTSAAPGGGSSSENSVPIGKSIFSKIDAILDNTDFLDSEKTQVEQSRNTLKDLMKSSLENTSNKFAEELGDDLAQKWDKWLENFSSNSGTKIPPSQSTNIIRHIKNTARDSVKNNIKFESKRYYISESRWAKLAGIKE